MIEEMEGGGKWVRMVRWHAMWCQPHQNASAMRIGSPPTTIRAVHSSG